MRFIAMQKPEVLTFMNKSHYFFQIVDKSRVDIAVKFEPFIRR